MSEEAPSDHLIFPAQGDVKTFDTHVGGAGNVWLVHAVNHKTGVERIGIFSSADKAVELMVDELDDDWSSRTIACIVDIPSYHTHERSDLQ